MCRGYFSSQEIDTHHATEHRSTDQSRNGCRMCCFCHAQPFEITRAKNIKSTFWQHSCQNAKVVEAFCHVACRLSNQCRPSIHQPTIDEFRMPAEMSIALSRAHLYARMHVASCWRRVHHRDRHQHTIPITLAAPPGAILPATSCLGAFWTPASSVCQASRRCRRPNQSSSGPDDPSSAPMASTEPSATTVIVLPLFEMTP
jgi:hypothetical protein